jgi:HPt (histidine-containing phosphotransfer) domain-containing protein
VAHTLKSSSASVGAQTLAGLCAEVEVLLRDGTGDALEPRLDALTAEAARVLAAVKPEGAA